MHTLPCWLGVSRWKNVRLFIVICVINVDFFSRRVETLDGSTIPSSKGLDIIFSVIEHHIHDPMLLIAAWQAS